VFEINPESFVQTSSWGNYDFYGDRHLTTPNEPNGLAVSYYLREARERKVAITIADQSKRAIRTLTGTSHQGLNSVRWDMRDGSGRVQPAGDYLATVEIDGQSFTRTARIRHPG
jgi:flagellar hook assembly protein FlgD